MVVSFIDPFFRLFFPRLCKGCGSDAVGRDQLLCLSCLDRLPFTRFHFHANNPVEKIFWGRLPLLHATAHLFFTKGSVLQHLLHQLKYKGQRDIGRYFGRSMGEAFQASARFCSIEGLVPLPLFAAREHRRGYNQAAIICEGISEVMKVPVMRDVVSRTVATASQTHKTRMERWENMNGKFFLRQADSIAHKHILLVDDVVTTGATLEACGKELVQAEGIRLSIATLAYALV